MNIKYNMSKLVLYQKTIKSIVNIPIFIFTPTGQYTDTIGYHPDYEKLTPNDNINLQDHSYLIVQDSVFLLYFTQANVAHSICQLIRSLYEYVQYGENKPIVISECIKQMPFLDLLVKVLFPYAHIEYMKEDILYYYEDVYMPKYIWFTDCIPLESVYDSANNVRILQTSGELSPEYNDLYEPLKYFDAKIRDICSTFTSTHIHKNIFMIKTTKCEYNITPSRAITLVEPEVDAVLAQYNYMTMMDPTQYTSCIQVVQHIYTLRNAENIITSYGGANCCNRFFFNPNANIKVICNKQYEDEYQQDFHPRCSAYRAKQYILLLDMPDTLTGQDITRVIEYKNEKFY